MADIYTYTDYRVFIKDHSVDLKKEDKSFSQRFLLKQMKISSTGFIANVISGKKNLTPTHVLKMAKIFKLKKAETRYFETLVLFNQAKTLDEKNEFYNRLLTLQGVSTKYLQKREYNLFSRWYYVAIREALYFLEVKDDYRLLAKIMEPSITAAQAEKAVKDLLALDLIEYDEEGFLKQKEESLSADTGDVGSMQLANFQIVTMELAKRALNKFQSDERDVSTMTLTLSAESMDKVKEETAEYRKRLAKIAFDDKAADQVYQMNVQLFPLTKQK
ncbi:MAG: TIGR02147 family protein [Fibrobacterales bacterium]